MLPPGEQLTFEIKFKDETNKFFSLFANGKKCLSTREMIAQSFSPAQRTPHNSSNWNKGRLRKKNHCHVCQYSTYNKVALEEHVAMHDRTDGFQCDYSSYRSPKKSITSLHMRRDHGHPIVVIKPKKKQILTPDKVYQPQHFLKYLQ